MNNFLKFTALSALACMMPSCEPERFEGDVVGTVVAEPASFHNGDEVKVNIGGNANLGIVVISGTEYPPIVHYEIDGVEVAKSNNPNSFFETTFIANDLTPGEHTLSASVPVIYANIDYNIQLKPSTITVLDVE